jgi:hypothetical protein
VSGDDKQKTQKETLRVSRAYGDKQIEKQLENKPLVVMYEHTIHSFIDSLIH